MAVAFDAKNTADTTSNSATTLTNSNLTITAGLTNSILVAWACFGAVTLPTISQFQWDKLGTPQNLTAVPSATAAGSGGSCVIYALRAPTAGNKQLSLTWTSGASLVYLACASFQGVDQTSIAVACPNGRGGTGSSASASTGAITSAAADMVVGAFITNVAGNINSVSGTSVFIDNTGSTNDGAASRNAGAATVTLTATLSASGAWSAAGCDLLAAAAVGGSPLRRNASLDGLGASGPFFSNPLARRMLGWRKGLLIPVGA